MKTTRKTESSSATVATSSPAEDYAAKIAEAAYFIAEQRGFAPGFELEDWLAAEVQMQNESA